MLVTVKYYGMLTEAANCKEEIIDFSGVYISELLEKLFIKYPSLKDKQFQVAQNQELVSYDAKLTGTELVLLPPFSGG